MKIAISLVIVYLGIDSTVFPFEQGFEKNLFSRGGWGLGFYLIWAVYVSLVPKIMVFELFWSIKGTYRFCSFWPEINRVCFLFWFFIGRSYYRELFFSPSASWTNLYSLSSVYVIGSVTRHLENHAAINLPCSVIWG